VWKEYRRVKRRLIILVLGWLPFGFLIVGVASLVHWLYKIGFVKFGFVLEKSNFVLGISYMAFAMVTLFQYQLFRCPNCDVCLWMQQIHRRTCRNCGIPINPSTSKS
jgi:hypothetical protein